jgi:hypothetical protein
MPGLIALEWIEESGGAEKVLDAIVDTFPDADIACLWDDAPGRYPNTQITESWLARTPLRGRKAMTVPLLPSYWRMAKAQKKHDWLLVSSHTFAHQANYGTRGRAAVPLDRQDRRRALGFARRQQRVRAPAHRRFLEP